MNVDELVGRGLRAGACLEDVHQPSCSDGHAVNHKHRVARSHAGLPAVPYRRHRARQGNWIRTRSGVRWRSPLSPLRAYGVTACSRCPRHVSALRRGTPDPGSRSIRPHEQSAVVRREAVANRTAPAGTRRATARTRRDQRRVRNHSRSPTPAVLVLVGLSPQFPLGSGSLQRWTTLPIVASITTYVVNDLGSDDVPSASALQLTRR